MNLDRRLAGVLLHPTSLPGRFGIGDLGPECIRLLDWIRDAGLGWWQVLPLGPTSYGDSPYQCFSAFAGNPMLVSPDLLVADGLLKPLDIEPPPFPHAKIDYGWVIQWKTALLRIAHRNFLRDQPAELVAAYAAFKKRKDIATWLEDYALFRVCKDLHDGKAWDQWDKKLRTRDAAALKKVATANAENVDFHAFAQFLFFSQWERVREAAKKRGVGIIGDAPIYVAYDSSDTWANQDIFMLDKNGLPKAVAGVPPDYFSATGQLWGNPLYDWDVLAERKYDWWISRMQSVFNTVDVVRLDHFRGFMGYWAVKFGEKTAVNGKWMRGPGAPFFAALQRKFKSLPIIAEDLGEITPDVIEVRDKFNLPGMKIMQFAFGVANTTDPIVPDPGHAFHLHNHTENMVVYTGTHDNDTTMGWWRSGTNPRERAHLQMYLATDGNMANWDLIRASFMSVARTAVIPMQDFLGLGTECRMNFPGKAEANWAWRMTGDQLNWDVARRVRSMALLYQRCANTPPEGLPKAAAVGTDYLSN